MPIGPVIRRIFGPCERQISSANCAFYFDIDAYVDRLRQWKPSARNILEVGCGEGAVTEKLRTAWPEAETTGIDLTPRLGRLYAGRRDGVRFIQGSIQQIAAAEQEWERNHTPIYWLGYISDRWPTGDRISYMTREAARERSVASFGRAALFAEARIAPWRNNIAMLAQP
jgi:hypothetical protein